MNFRSACRRRLTIVSALLVFCLFCGFWAGIGFGHPLSTDKPETQSIELTAEERAWLEAHPKIVLAVPADSELSFSVNPDGTQQGFFVDLGKVLEERLDLPIELRPISPAAMFPAIMEGHVDGTFLATSSALEMYDVLLTRSYLQFFPTIYALSDLGRPIKSFSELKGLRVAYYKGSQYARVILQPYAEQCEIIPYDTTLAGLRAVFAGTADVFLGGNYDIHTVNKEMLSGIRIAHVDWNRPLRVCAAIGPGKLELASILDKGLASIIPQELNTVLQRWIPAELIRPSNIDFTERERQWLQDHPVIELVVDSAASPYSFRDDQGRFSGLLAEVCNRLETMLGVRFSYEYADYPTLVEHVFRADRDMLSAVDPFDAPYDKHYLKTGNVAFMPFGLFAIKGSPMAGQGVTAAKGKRIAIIEGWSLDHPALKSLADCDFVYSDSSLGCINLVLRGEADGVFDIIPLINHLLRQHSIRNLQLVHVSTYGQQLAFFVKREWSLLHSILNKALDTWSEQERVALQRKWNAYLDEPLYRLVSLELTDEERRWLIEHPTIRVGVDRHWKPIEFVDEGGRQQGISVDYLQWIADGLGLSIEWVSRPEWEDTLDMLKTGRLDLLGCVARTDQRAEYLDFSDPYLTLPVVVFARTDTPYIAELGQLKGRKVALPVGYAVHEWLTRDYPQIDIVSAPSTEEAFRLLAHGQVDAVLATILSTGTVLSEHGYTQIKVAGETPYHYEQCIGVRKDWPIMAGILQKALDVMPTAERNAISQKWMAVSYEQPFDYSLLWKILGAVAVVVLVIVLWNRSLAYQVKRRISELAAINEKLSCSEQRYREIFNATSDALLIHDQTGRILEINEQAFRMFGIDRDAVGELSIDDISLGQSPYSQGEGRAWVERAIREGSQVFEWMSRKQSGTTFWSEVALHCSQIAGQMRVVASIRDISERKQAEDALRDSESRYRALFEEARDAIVVTQEDRIIDCNQFAEQLYGATREKLIGRRPHELSPSTQADGRDSIKKGGEMIRRAMAGESFTFDWLHQRLDGTVFEAEVSLSPLMVSGRMQLLAIVRDVSERMREERIRREQEENLRLLVDTSQDWLWTMDLEGAHTYSNPAVQDILGYTPEEIVGGNSLNLIHPEDRAFVGKQLPGWIEKKEGWRNILLRWVHKDGSIRYLESNAVPILDDQGQLVGFRGVDRDTTDRRLAEEDLAQERQFLQAIFDSLPGTAYVFDEEGRFLRWNKGYETILGYSHEEMTRKVILDTVAARDRERTAQTIEEGLRNGQASIELQVLARDGHEIPMYCTGVVVEIGGKRMVVGIGLDISDRLRAEEELARTQNLLMAAFESSPAGILVADAPDVRIRIANSAALGIRGESRESLTDIPVDQHPIHWQTFYPDGSMIKGEDLPLSRSVLKGEICRNEEVVVRRADGETRVILANSAPVLNAEGEITAGVVVFSDITERKRAEIELRQNRNMLNQVLNSVPQSIFWKDRHGVYMGCNDLFARAVGLDDPALIVGKTDYDLTWSVQETEQYRADDRAVIESGQAKRHIIESVQQIDGTKLWVDTSKMPLCDEHGEVYGVLGVFDDITERMQMEQALRDSQKQMYDIIDFLPDPTFAIDCRGTVIAWNRAMEEVTGVPASAMLGKGNYEYALPFYNERHPMLVNYVFQDWPEYKPNYLYIKKVGDLLFAESVACRIKGQSLYLSGKASPIRDAQGEIVGAIESIRDITEIKESERERMRLIAILERTPDLVSMATPDRTVTYMNAAGRRMIDYPEDKDIRELCIESLHPEWAYRLITEEGVPTACRQGFWQGETALCRRDGSEFPVTQIIVAHQSPSGELEYLSTVIHDITDLKEAERSLRTSENRLRLALEAANDALWDWNLKTGQTYYSPRWYTMLDYEPGALEMNYDSFVRICHPDDLKPTEAQIRRHLEGGESIYQAEFRLKTHSGSWRWIMGRGRVMEWDEQGKPLRLIGTNTDITERKRAEMELRQSSERLQLALHASHMGTWDWDLKKNDVYWSPETMQIFGISEAQFGGDYESYLAFATPDHRGEVERRVRDFLQRAVDASVLFYEHPINSGDGKMRWVEVRGTLYVNEQGEPARMIGVCGDITERKRIEQEIRQLNEDLEQRVLERTAQLESANQELNDFAYVVSHDLKAPLRAIGQLAHWLTEDHGEVLGDEGRQKTELMSQRVARMYRLIDAILDYSRIGRIEEKRQPVDLIALVNEAVDLLSPLKSININIDANLPVIQGERTRLFQVFQNLIGNALKFVDKQSGQIQIGCVDDGDFWKIFVRDNGPGIDPKYHEKIFGIFQTLAPRDQIESTGIGLTLVRKIVELHGGKVSVQSTPGRGSTFYVSFPKNT